MWCEWDQEQIEGASVFLIKNVPFNHKVYTVQGCLEMSCSGHQLVIVNLSQDCSKWSLVSEQHSKS